MFERFNEGFLRHPYQSHNPCYRKVLAYTLYRYARKNELNIVDEAYTEMINRFGEKKLFTIPGFLEMYPAQMIENVEDSIGYLIVDSGRDGCFPLVMSYFINLLQRK